MFLAGQGSTEEAGARNAKWQGGGEGGERGESGEGLDDEKTSSTSEAH